jgi:hypothetical protein
MSLHIRSLSDGSVVEIHTDQPNPYGIEWSAVDGNYDAEWAGEEDGWVSSSPRGWGKGEDEAIADLIEQLEKREAVCSAL